MDLSAPGDGGIRPESSPGSKAKLVSGDSTIQVDVKHSVTDGKESIELLAHGEPVEKETYAADATGFYMTNAAGEDFEPQLPLLKYPTRTGDTYQWSGTISSGGISHPGKATTRVTEDWITAKPASMKAILSTVEVQIDGGGDKPALRTLKYWIVKDHGVVQRDFSYGWKRVPEG